MAKQDFLIVVDMQNDFIDGSLGTTEAVSIVSNVVNKINNWDGPIIATRDTHHGDYLTDSLEGKHLPVEHCIEGGTGWEIQNDVAVALAAKDTMHGIVDKPSFGSLSLIDRIYDVMAEEEFTIEEKESLTITFIGLCTDICVLANAIIAKTYFTENELYVDETCCAGTSVARHNAALDSMRSCQINIVNE